MITMQQNFRVAYSYPVIFTRDVFGAHNTALLDAMPVAGKKLNRVLLAIDSNIVDSTPGLLARIEEFGRRNRDVMEFVGSPILVRGGEICKNEPLEVAHIQALTHEHHICRHSFILAIGGGAVLDAVGFAAATAHRGVRLIRMPTTTLAQNDAGIGVKNGINAFGRKNYLGTFAPPFAVINDFDFLKTLSARDMRAGIAEGVKVALIKDSAYFDELYAERYKLAAFAPEAMEKMIIRCAELHMEHICQGGDPFEEGASRPLDFGHWSAHNLEELSSGEIKHGEAVAIGIALDSLYSRHIGGVSEQELQMILTILEDIGFDLYHPALERIDIDRALQGFREHLGGELTITMLKCIGGKTDLHEIDTMLMRRCIDTLAKRKNGKEDDYVCALQPHAG